MRLVTARAREQDWCEQVSKASTCDCCCPLVHRASVSVRDCTSPVKYERLQCDGVRVMATHVTQYPFCCFLLVPLEYRVYIRVHCTSISIFVHMYQTRACKKNVRHAGELGSGGLCKAHLQQVYLQQVEFIRSVPVLHVRVCLSIHAWIIASVY